MMSSKNKQIKEIKEIKVKAPMCRSRIVLHIHLGVVGNLLPTIGVAIFGLAFHPLCAASISRK